MARVRPHPGRSLPSFIKVAGPQSLSLGRIMGHHNNGDLFFGLHLHDDLFDDLRIRLIDGSGGLIQEEDFRLQYHAPGQAQAVTLASGEVESPVEYRTLFHSVDVKLVQAKTEEFAKKLAAISQQTRKGFLDLKFR